MTLSVKGVAITVGIFWALWVAWSVFVSIIGIGNAPFDFFSQMYFGWITPDWKGFVIGAILGFIDGIIAGLIFTWIYNAIAKKKAA